MAETGVSFIYSIGGHISPPIEHFLVGLFHVEYRDLSVVELHEPVSERIGKILRENREAQGLTRQQLSEKSTVSDRQISAIELGEKGPSMNSLELLLRSLGLSADQIFYPELTEKDPMLTQITHLAASCTEQQKRMVVRFIRMLQDEEYGD